jgi:prefoldin subunit 5
MHLRSVRSFIRGKLRDVYPDLELDIGNEGYETDRDVLEAVTKLFSGLAQLKEDKMSLIKKLEALQQDLQLKEEEARSAMSFKIDV